MRLQTSFICMRCARALTRCWRARAAMAWRAPPSPICQSACGSILRALPKWTFSPTPPLESGERSRPRLWDAITSPLHCLSIMSYYVIDAVGSPRCGQWSNMADMPPGAQTARYSPTRRSGSRVFAAAMRHSARVRFLGSLSSAARSARSLCSLRLRCSIRSAGWPAGVSIDGIGLDGTKVTMEHPKLTGFRKDGRPYLVNAKRGGSGRAASDRRRIASESTPISRSPITAQRI